jgi:RNA recognition motif-containing protein
MVVRLYIGNLPFEVDDAGLGELLAPFGSVEEARVVTNARNKSRGFGFATLQTDQPDEVMASLNERSIAGRPLQERPAHASPSFQRSPRPFDRDQRRGRPRRDA